MVPGRCARAIVAGFLDAAFVRFDVAGFYNAKNALASFHRITDPAPVGSSM